MTYLAIFSNPRCERTERRHPPNHTKRASTDASTATAALSAAIFLHHALHLADCESRLLSETRSWILTLYSFAFVEYESRRDADDAYYEMHNKRIGRDDLLKIEVRQGKNHTISRPH